MRFVETYGIRVPPKQRYLLKKTVINIAPNKQLSVRKALQLYLPCLSRLDLPWSTVYHTDSQRLNISAKYYSVIMVCLKLILYCSGSSFPKTVLGQNKPAKQKSSLRTELFIPNEITRKMKDRLTAGMENGSTADPQPLHSGLKHLQISYQNSQVIAQYYFSALKGCGLNCCNSAMKAQGQTRALGVLTSLVSLFPPTSQN